MKLSKFTNFLLILFCTIILFGCGGKSDNRNETVGDDLPRNDDGSADIDSFDNVQINLRSVIGNPDLKTLEQLIRKFNIEYEGRIQINLKTVGHSEYYSALETDYVSDWANFPDMCLLHNEKNIEYAMKNEGYFRSLDECIEQTKINISFDDAYENIARTTIYEGKHYGIPIDAHGYLMQFRQDIIKKNGLGFDNNTRYIPETYDEFQKLLVDLRTKADNGELLIRNINTNADHSWFYADPATFYPAYYYEPEWDNLSALYVNGGSLLDTNGNVNIHNNDGFKKYVTDIVDRYQNRLLGDPGQKEEVFPTGNIVMYSEGPWWVAGDYNVWWNNGELKKPVNGVTVDEAADPVYNNPYVAARAKWWAQEGAPEETADKWYGNGHVFAITKKVTSLKKIAACLEFARWFTQEMDDDGNYYLTEWCKAGHIPAWKNVYNSDNFKNAVKNSHVLTAMGDPADIITLESTIYASTLINGVNTVVGNVHIALESGEITTKQEAIDNIVDTCNSLQQALNLMKLGS